MTICECERETDRKMTDRDGERQIETERDRERRRETERDRERRREIERAFPSLFTNIFFYPWQAFYFDNTIFSILCIYV